MDSGIETIVDSRIERQQALCRSVLYQALALGFGPPAARTLTRLGGAAIDALAEAAAAIDDRRNTRLEPLAMALRRCPDAGSVDRLSESRRRLFGHTARGPFSPYETEYGEDTLFQKPQEMSDIAAFLRAFGLRLDPRAGERIDHVACEVELMAFLSRKEAHALEIDDAIMLGETRKAARLFLKDHLGRFLPAFAGRIQDADPEGFYGRLAALAAALLRHDCARLQVTPGPEALRLRAPIDDRAPMACGGASGCGPASCGDGPDGGEGPDGAEGPGGGGGA